MGLPKKATPYFNNNADDDYKGDQQKSLRENLLIDDAMKLEKYMLTNDFIKDRRYKLKNYKQCFLGRQMVEIIMMLDLENCVENAVQFGNELVEANIIQHVTQGHKFENADFFYRFIAGYKGKMNEDDVEIDEICSVTKELRGKYAATAQRLELYMHQNGFIKDRRYRLKTYRQCFIGRVMMAKIMLLRLAENEEDALKFGNDLMRGRIIRHVSNEHNFKNGHFFYEFVPGYDADLVLGKKVKSKKTTNDNT